MLNVRKNFVGVLGVGLVFGACTRPVEDTSRVGIRLPSASSQSYAVAKAKPRSQKVSALSTQWSLSDPTLSNQINCYAVGVRDGESKSSNACKNLAGDVILQPTQIAGAFPAGSNQELIVRSGRNLEIYLIGFQTDQAALCQNIFATATGLDPVHFSAPVLLDTVPVNFQPGNVELAMKVPAILPANGKFEDCAPVKFHGSNSTGDPALPGAPLLAVNAPSVSESAGTLNVSVTLSAATQSDVTFNYATSALTASSSGDFISVTSSATIPAGDLSIDLPIAIAADALDEDDETFSVVISGASSNATIGTALALVTITDDDASPEVSFSTSSGSQTEGGGAAVVAVVLSAASGRSVVVPLTINGSSTATSGSDFTPPGTMSVSFSPGETSQNFNVTMSNDGVLENQETLIFNLGVPTNASLGTLVSFTLSILDDETPTATLSGTPANPSAVASLNVTVGGSYVTYYKYWEGMGTNCSSAIYGSVTPVGTAITSSISGLGNHTLCVLGKTDSGTWQTTATSFTWFYDGTSPSMPGSLTNRNLNPSLHFSPIFEWTQSNDTGSGLSHYEVSIGSTSGGTNILSWNNVGLQTRFSAGGLSLTDGVTYYFNVRAFDFVGNVSATATDPWMVDLTPNWVQQAYLKAVNNDTQDKHGMAVALDGDTLVVGADDASNQSAITNGASASSDNSLFLAGAVYVYKRNGTTWTQEAYLKPMNVDSNDRFGFSVDIHEDTIVVGAIGESSNQTNITNGSSASFDNSVASSGAAYVFVRSGGVWTQQAYIKAANANAADYFGFKVAVNKDTIVVGVPNEDSSQATITNGTGVSFDNSASNAGAVYVFKRTAGNWNQEAYIKAANAAAADSFGDSVDISGDTIVVGAYGEDSNQTTITNGGTASINNSASYAGAAYVYKRTGSAWAQEAYLKASNAGANDKFGDVVSIFNDTVVVTAWGEASNSTAVDNTDAFASADNSATNAGAAYVFGRSGATWYQAAYLKPSNAIANLSFGSDASIYGDTIVIGASYESSCQTTPTYGGSSSFNTACSGAGAAYVFQDDGFGYWSQSTYLKAPNAEANDGFGMGVAISGSGIAVGAPDESSNQSYIDNNSGASSDNSSLSSGAVYLFDP